MSEMSTREDVVIVGGGAVGVCCAYELARVGRSVLLVEQGGLAAGSSYGNSGLIPTSVCSPLAAPGVIGQSLRWMLDPNGAFRLRPRLEPGFARWLWLFGSFCNEPAWERGSILARDLIRASRVLFEELALKTDFAYRQAGVLALYRSQEALEHGVEAAKTLTRLDIVSELLNRATVEERVPRIGPEVVGGIHFPEDANLDPPLFVRSIATLAETLGARVQTGSRVLRIDASRGSISSIETSEGSLEPQLVILAAGAWSPKLVSGLDLRLIIEPAKGYSLTFPGESFGPAPLRLSEARTVVTSLTGRVRATSRLDLVGFDLALDERRLRGIPHHVGDYLELEPDQAPGERWCGLRPLTPDGLPIIGRHDTLSNLLLATGHGHLGVALSPITGRLVGQLAVGEEPQIDLRPFEANRFVPRAWSARGHRSRVLGQMK
jgi:D-amino-acid dehydrogenase